MSVINDADIAVVLFSTSAIFFLALVYPYIIYPLILRCLPKQPYGVLAGGVSSKPKMAMLFCAYNEEQSLPAKIDNIRQIKKDFPDLEVRAYTDGCSDRTVALLREASDVITLHEGRSRLGKASGMRELVGATDAEIVIFTDANVILDAEAIPRIAAYFDDAAIGTVAGTLHYTNPDDGQAARTGSLYWRLEELIKRLESETGSTTGADGSIFAMRRDLYPVVPANLLDDMIASISPLFSGYRVVTAADVHAFEKATTDSRDEFHRKRRIACRAFHTHRHLAPQLRTMSTLNRFKYFSHKYLRWFSAVFLLLGSAFALAGIAALAGLNVALIVLVAGLLVLLAGRQLNVPVLGVVAEITVSMLAVGLGIAEAVAGRNYQVWNPAKSRQ
jgi:cellulose synthase/poly-beta-1,6-N-acetylglucosamine synthase-like glycosyltransferase